jgi:thiopurine S-methyltransferase
MEPDFWHQRWEKNETAWHENKANPLLVKYFNELSLANGRRVFVPLCGKTLDISWLLSNGYRVAGVELSQRAIEQLFMDLAMQPDVSHVGELEVWSAKHVDIVVGNIFAVTKKMLGAIDAVYDRAALVALPGHLRGRYTAHLTDVTATAPQLLICYEYDQSAMEGPPFSISREEVIRHYAEAYEARLIATAEVSGGLKGKCYANEHVWLLRPR